VFTARYVLRTQFIYVFCVDVRTNSDCFTIQHLLIRFYNRDGVCLLRGTFCAHSLFMCFVWIGEQTAIISLYNINWLVSITETKCLLRGTLCSHSVFMCFVRIWEQTANISLYSINVLVFITEMECVHCAVLSAHTVYLCVCVDLRTNSDYFTVQHYLTGFYNRYGVCLLRGTFCPQCICVDLTTNSDYFTEQN
jgi:hypothetical protein